MQRPLDQLLCKQKGSGSNLGPLVIISKSGLFTGYSNEYNIYAILIKILRRVEILWVQKVEK